MPLATEIFDGVLGDAPEPEGVGSADEVAHGRRTTFSTFASPAVASRRPASAPTSGSRSQYLDSWLRGIGAAAIDNLMEDAATAEISRSQLWLWITQSVALENGSPFDAERYAAIRDEEVARLGGAGSGRLAEAAGLLDRLVLDEDFADFLTLRAYSLLE